jgi:hypothetical protein
MKMAELSVFWRDSFWIFLASLVFSVLFLWLFVVGGNRYSVEDAEAHSEDFAGIVREGHGGMTAFLWVSFSMILVWTVYYFAANWQQFVIIFV